MKTYATPKAAFIGGYFDDLEDRIAALTTLAVGRFKTEALTLCLVYIDGLAQLLSWPSDRSGLNYVGALTDFSHDAELGLVHPKQLAEALDRMKGPWPAMAAIVRSAFPGPTYQLLTSSAALSALTPHLSQKQLKQLAPEVWRGTIAAIAYFWMRNPAVHALGSSTFSFGNTTFNGQPVKALDLERLQSAAHKLASEARRRSEANDQWFGNDQIVA